MANGISMYRSAGAASYNIVDSRGAVVRRVAVGDTRGYNGGQYADGFALAQRMANTASNRTGEAYSVQFDSPWSGGPKTQYRAPGTAAYAVRDGAGNVVRRVQVGDIRGYDGGQYRDGFDAAKRMADAAANHTGQPFSVSFESPWSR